MRRPDPVELLVLQQQRHRRVVDPAQHPGPGVGQLHAGPGERPQHLGRRVGVQPAYAERVGDPGGQLGQPARRAADRGRLAEQLGAGSRRARRPARAARPRPSRRRSARRPTRRRPAAGTGRGARSRRSGRAGRRTPGSGPSMPGAAAGRRGGVEERALRRGPGGSAGARRRVGRHRRAGQPGPGGGQRARLAPAAGVPEQQRLGQLDVVAALDPDPGAQQRRVDRGGRRPRPSAGARRPPGRRTAAARSATALGRAGGPAVGDRRGCSTPPPRSPATTATTATSAILPHGCDTARRPGRRRAAVRAERPSLRVRGRSGARRYFTAPAVRPDWICRWKIAYTMIIGRIAMVSAANSADQSAS